MAKLFFRYGAMNSGKSTQLLQVRHNYHERHQKVFTLKPVLDDRDGADIIKSRLLPGVKADVVVDAHRDLFRWANYRVASGEQIDCLLVDECQFLTPAQVIQLGDVVDTLGIPVMCYGLRADAFCKLFPATEVLMAMADNIEELKTICWCGKKATINARVINDQVVYEGPQVLVGGNDRYTSLCRKHWKTGQLHP